jgi:flagella basal body P-ring formation protein FlgA
MVAAVRLALAVFITALLGTSLGAQAPAAPLGVERTVPVAARALPRGTTISPADYQIIPTVVRPALKSALAADSGWITRRPIAAGEALVEPAVGPPALVTSGQAVTFVAEQAGIRLAIHGTAATGGALGDQVWVRMESGRRLRGVITAPATVRADTTALR